MDPQIGWLQLIVVFRIGHGGLEYLVHVARRMLRHELQDSEGFGGLATTDCVGDEANLARRALHVAGHRPCLCHERSPAYFSAVERSVFPPWPRKWRVGANSPRRWPTIFSLMKTGTCRRP